MIGINCLKYDVEFQREIIEKQNIWFDGIGAKYDKRNAPVRNQTSKGTKRKSQKSHAKRPAPLRRKQIKTEDSSDDDAMDIDNLEAIKDREESEKEDGAAGEEIPEVPYTPRGTRSRPGTGRDAL